MEAFYSEAQAGHFYAVGVGPGAPDLMTLRARNLVRTANVVIAPRSSRSDESLALQTVKPWIADQEVVEHVYPMKQDIDVTLRSWEEMACLTAERCARGQSVVQITIGDPLVYSTSCYLLDQVRPQLGAENVHVVPGISAFQAAAALRGRELTIQNDRMLLMPATDMGAVEEALGQCETLVLYKCARKIKELTELLDRHGLADRAWLACSVEQEGKQFVTSDLKSVSQKQGYMATVLIDVGHRPWTA